MGCATSAVAQLGSQLPHHYQPPSERPGTAAALADRIPGRGRPASG